MFLVQAKTVAMEAVQAVFGPSYPYGPFQNLWVSMEYPAEQANYPGIWVDFTPTAPLQVAGIGHIEYITDTLGQPHAVTRWRFGGMIQLTVVAMTSLERDMLADELVRVIAFGRENPNTSQFRQTFEHNNQIAMQVQWDRFSLTGKAETPGTPWGTDDVLYEMSITLDCQGDFLSGDLTQQGLAWFSSLAIYSAPDGDVMPTIPDSVVPVPAFIVPGNEQWQ